MNFSIALLILTAILTPLYLVISKLSEKGKHVVTVGKPKSKIDYAITVGIFVLLAIMVILQFTSNVTTPFFFVLFPCIVALLLYKVRTSQESSRFTILLTVIILHLIVLSIFLPLCQVFFSPSRFSVMYSHIRYFYLILLPLH